MRKEWEKDMPLGVADVLSEYISEKSTKGVFRELEKADLDVVTPLSEIKRVARSYSKRFKVPVRIDAKYMDKEHPGADAAHVYRKGKSIIYLHPILKYYTPEYVKGVIEHEIDHMKVEQKWEKII